jgi:hypothetical protein
MHKDQNKPNSFVLHLERQEKNEMISGSRDEQAPTGNKTRKRG